MRPNDDKLRELILYIAEHSEGDLPFGKVKLQKILFYADFIMFARSGRSITGQQYTKFPYGPVIRKVDALLDELQAAGSLALANRTYHGKLQQRPLALREPELGRFTGEEIAIVDQVIGELRGRSAKDVSDLSHQFLGWEVTEMYQPIPYETVLVDAGPPTEDEEEYARSLVEAGR